MRTARVSRTTRETDIQLSLKLDGEGKYTVSTGIGFFDHMLTAFAVHGGFDLELDAKGDLQVDGHHTVEDTGIVLGQAFARALGDRAGIARYGSFFIPMDEALVLCALDISGRPYLRFEDPLGSQTVGGFDTGLTEEFLRAFAFNAGITLHVQVLSGKNAHHIIEAIFKALGHALAAACAPRGEAALSTKGVLG